MWLSININVLGGQKCYFKIKTDMLPWLYQSRIIIIFMAAITWGVKKKKAKKSEGKRNQKHTFKSFYKGNKNSLFELKLNMLKILYHLLWWHILWYIVCNSLHITHTTKQFVILQLQTRLIKMAAWKEKMLYWTYYLLMFGKRKLLGERDTILKEHSP